MTPKQIVLRGFELTDVEELLVSWNNLQYMNFSGRITPMSQEEGVNWIRNTWEEKDQGKVFTFAIEVINEAKLIGYVRLRILNNISRRADISIGIFDPKYRNKGLGTESLIDLINFGFDKLNLLSLELKVFTNNQLAIACYEKLGFKKIGVRRKADYVEGKFLDDLMMDLLVDEWKNNR